MAMCARADKGRILLVEDDATLREMLADLLRDEGWYVDVAGHGQAALDALRAMRQLPDVILLDLMMPVMNGWEFRAAQLARPELSSIPVVIVSAAGSVERTASALGAAGLVHKPIVVSELMAAVSIAMRTAQRSSERLESLALCRAGWKPALQEPPARLAR